MSVSVAEQLAGAVESLREPPREVRETAEKLVIDIAGLCIAARNSDYVKSALAAWEAGGACSAIGHGRALDAAGVELTCRASLVAPKLIHKAGFHPTAVLGAMGAAAGVAVALKLPKKDLV